MSNQEQQTKPDGGASASTARLGMVVGIPYIVTTPSDDGTFEIGDHISLCADGAIHCRDAGGWIESCDVQDATNGMAVEIDEDMIDQLRKRLREEHA